VYRDIGIRYLHWRDRQLTHMAKRQKTDLLKGTLDLLLLKTLALEPLHGVAVADRLAQITGGTFQVQAGSLFPALHRLESQGLLRSEWRENETGRDAKFYSLTKAGRAQLEVELTQWERLSAAIRLTLRNA